MSDQRYQAPVPQNQTCSICDMHQATLYCTCFGTNTFLCPEDLPSHYQKYLSIPHQILPIAVLGSEAVPRYYEQVQTRTVAFVKGKEELLESLRLVDKCCADYSTAITDLITTLETYRDTVITELQQWKGWLEHEIWEAINEVTASLSQETPVLAKPLSAALRLYEPGKLVLFQYQLQVEALMNAVQGMLTYTFKDLFSLDSGVERVPDILPGICHNSLFLYDLQGSPTKQATLAHDFTAGSVHCVLDDQTILCIGGSPATQEVYLLRLDDYSLSQVQSMLSPRGYPGVLKYGSFCYVFGGSLGFMMSQTSCEKYSLTEHIWRRLSNMQNARHAFTPCLYVEEVLLPDPYENHGVLESFNLRTELFKALPIRLPGAIEHTTVSCIMDGELVIISHADQMFKWKIHSTELTFSSFRVTNQGGYALSSCAPVRVGTELFWVKCDSGQLCVFNLDTLTLTTK